jgi:hypothetical protein
LLAVSARYVAETGVYAELGLGVGNGQEWVSFNRFKATGIEGVIDARIGLNIPASGAFTYQLGFQTTQTHRGSLYSAAVIGLRHEF